MKGEAVIGVSKARLAAVVTDRWQHPKPTWRPDADGHEPTFLGAWERRSKAGTTIVAGSNGRSHCDAKVGLGRAFARNKPFSPPRFQFGD